MIENGSIEVLQGDENSGFVISPDNPFDESSNVAAQVKSRTGITLDGSPIPLTADEVQRFGPGHVASYGGKGSGNSRAIVRIWRTAEGG